MTTLKERVEAVLELRGITAHAWSVAAGLSSAHVNMILAGRSREPRRATIEKLARAARVRTDWLMSGTGDPEPREADEPDDTEPAHAAPAHVEPDEGDTQDVPEPAEMPETLGQRRGYNVQEAATKRELVKKGEGVPEWVWPHVRNANNFTLANTAPSVAMLMELAKFIYAHGDPEANAKKNKK